MRQEQIELLNSKLGYRATLVLGGAGYGKTTLATQWQSQLAIPAAWLSLDNRDNQLDRFLRCLVDALQRVVPGACGNMAELLDSPQQTTFGNLVESFVDDVAAMDQPAVFILDDLHLVSSTEIHDFLVQVIQWMPKGFQMVFLSREEPRWPLPLWRSREWLHEIGPQQLQFSEEESRQLFLASVENPIRDELLETVHRRTEGWPAGLRFLLLSLRETNHEEAAAASLQSGSRQITRYLFSELINGLSPALLRFVERTAPLDRFCVELCDAIDSAMEKNVQKGKDSRSPNREHVEELMRRNLFLIPLDSEGRWFRYHHLFQDLVNNRSRHQFKESEVLSIWRQAGLWFHQSESTDEALGYLLRAGEFDQATAIFWQAMPMVMQHDLSRRTLSGLLSRFPEQDRDVRPELLLADGFVKIARYDLDGLAKTLKKATMAINDSSSTVVPMSELTSVLAALQSYSSFWQGEVEGALRQGKNALATLPKRFRISRAYATQYTFGGLLMSGKTGEAFEWIDRAIQEDTAEGSHGSGAMLVCKGFAYHILAQVDGMSESACRMKRLHQTKPMSDYWYGNASFLQGLAAYEHNDLDAAIKEFTEVLSYGVKLNSRLKHAALICMAKVWLAVGDLEKASNYTEEARQHSISANDPGSARVSDAMEARIRYIKIRQTVDQPPLPCKSDAVAIWSEVPTLTYAELMLHHSLRRDQHEQMSQTENQAFRAASAYIDAAFSLAKKLFNRRQVIVLSLLKAIALDRSEEIPAADRLLIDCLRIGSNCNLTRTFLDRGPRLSEILRRVSVDPTLREYRSRILDAFRASDSSLTLSSETHRPGPSESREKGRLENIQSERDEVDLSFREMDVLELMQLRLTNKEIASRLEIAAETVKKHAQNVFRKLDVSNRRQAVLKAESLGLLNAKER